MDMQNETTGEVIDVIVESSIVQQHERAAMDMQVATAQNLGRKIEDFQRDLKQWSCFNQEIAEECTYILKKGGKTIIGPSIRFAELLQAAYRHVVCETFIEEEGPQFIIVGATARDLFRNITIRARIKRRIVDKHGRRYGPDMIQTTTQAGASLALRNALIRLIPKALWQGVWLESRMVAQGLDPDTGERRVSIEEQVARAFKALGAFGAAEVDILAHLGVESRTDMDPNDLTLLRNKWRSISSGELDVGDAFPAPGDDKSGGEEQAADIRDRIKDAAEKKGAAAPEKAAKKKAKKAKKPKKAKKEESPPKEERIEQTDEPAHASVPMEDNLSEIPSVDL